MGVVFHQLVAVSPYRIGWPQRSHKAFTSVHANAGGSVAALPDNRGQAVAGTITGTSYTSMSEWLNLPGKNAASPPKPVVRTTMDWRQLPPEEDDEERTEEEKYPDLPRHTGPEDAYKRAYDNLAQKIAYRWPNPGEPRQREGCIGGTWRHIKEVLGHSGSQIVFVDGLVSVYDQQKFTDKLQAQLPYRPHIKPLYAACKGEMTPRQSLSPHPVLPGVPPMASHARDPNLARKLKLQERFPSTRRGHYAFP